MKPATYHSRQPKAPSMVSADEARRNRAIWDSLPIIGRDRARVTGMDNNKKTKLQIAQSVFAQTKTLERSHFQLPIVRHCIAANHRCEDLEIATREEATYKCGYYGDDLRPSAERCKECKGDPT